MPADAIERLLEALVKPAYMGVIGGDQSAMDEARALLAEFQAEVKAEAVEELADERVGPFSGFGMWYLENVRHVLRTKAKEVRDG